MLGLIADDGLSNHFHQHKILHNRFHLNGHCFDPLEFYLSNKLITKNFSELLNSFRFSVVT